MGSATENEVAITGTTSFAGEAILYGGYSFYNNANLNKVSITSQGEAAPTFSQQVKIHGGYNDENASANNNEVSITGSATKRPAFRGWNTYIYGGRGGKNASGNVVTITNGDFKNADGQVTIYGGYANDTGDGNNGNQVTLENVAFDSRQVEVYGSKSFMNGINNSVTIRGNTIMERSNNYSYVYIMGAKTSEDDDEIEEDKGNQVSILGSAAGTPRIKVNSISIYGVDSQAVKATDNQVIIQGASIIAPEYPNAGNTSIYGAYGQRYGGVTATNNSVTLKDAVLDYSAGQYGYINIGGAYGYRESSTLRANAVNITDTSFAGPTHGSIDIYGAYANRGNTVLMENAVQITGGAFNSPASIYGAYADENGCTATGNSVSLAGEITGAANLSLYGCNDNIAEGSHSGNTLYVGSQDLAFTSDGGNKVALVKSFDTVALRNVEYSASAPALAAGSFEKVGGLDLTSLSFVDGEGKGYVMKKGDSMALLASETANDFASLPLTYKGGATTLNAENPDVSLSAALTATDSGVTLDYTQESTISINQDGANNYQNVTYTAGDATADKLTFGNVAWKDEGALIDHNTTWSEADFSADTAIDTANLSFTNPEEVGGEMTRKSAALSNGAVSSNTAGGTIPSTAMQDGATATPTTPAAAFSPSGRTATMSTPKPASVPDA